MLSATSTDLASCPRCSGRVQLSLGRFARDIAGTRFGAFLAHHLTAYHSAEIRAVIGDIRPGLPEPLEGAVDDLAIDLAERIDSGELEERDTAQVLESVVRGAVVLAKRSGISIGDATALDFFEAAVLETALLIDGRSAVRDRLLAAERGWFARYWWSGLCGAAGLFLLLWQPAWLPQIVGWTLLGLAFIPPVASWIRERVEAAES
ncbi:MAG: hypothetical protein P8Y15_04710 [Gemmatimonadales bacterium]